MKPHDRLSPRNRLTPPITIICGTSDWTVAEFGGWDGEPGVLGGCWNGDINNPDDKGNPRSHGEGTWFIIPTEIAFVIRHSLPLIQLLIKTLAHIERYRQAA